jgi:peptide/nickel transport system substrate-binding protein
MRRAYVRNLSSATHVGSGKHINKQIAMALDRFNLGIFTRGTVQIVASAFLVGIMVLARPAESGPNRPTLRVAVGTTPNSLNPLTLTQSSEVLITSMIFDGLVSATLDGKIVPVLAAVVPTSANGGISRDGRTITYKLRRGIKWHDGTPFSSRDVIFTQRAALNPNNNIPSRDPYRSVSRIDAPDDATVVVHLAKPYAPFVVEWFADGGILPAHLLASHPNINDLPFNAAPIGTGAFVFDHWDRGREIVLRANDAYVLGKPKIGRIVIQLMADDTSRGVALRTGETDWAFGASETMARQFTGNGPVRPVLIDVRVRRAIALALDRRTMVAKISGAFAEPATANIGPALWAYDPHVKPLPYDQAQSRALLEAAGWKLGANGLRERSGKPLTLQLTYAAGSRTFEAYGVQIQASLHAVGIDVAIKAQQPNVLYAPAAQHGVLMSGDFDMVYLGFTSSSDPNTRKAFGCAAIPPGGFNVSRWCDAEYERITIDALLQMDRVTRKSDYSRASQILIDQVPEVFVTWPKDIELVRSGVHIDDGARNFAPPYLYHIDR